MFNPSLQLLCYEIRNFNKNSGTKNSFVFGLNGMPEIKLAIKEQIPSSKLVLGSTSDKLPFTLTALIEALGEDSSAIQLHFEGEFNAMMAMMIKGPITKFMETLVHNMHKL